MLESPLIDPDHIEHRVDDIRYILVAQARVEGQAQHARVVVNRDRKAIGKQLILVTIVGVQMYRNEMNRRRDVSLRQLFDELIPTYRQPSRIQPEHVQVPRVLHFTALDWNFQRITFGESSCVRLHDLATSTLECVQLSQLAEAERGGDVRHVVLESGAQHFVAPAPTLGVAAPGIATHAVEADDTRLVEKVAVSGEHSSFAGRQILCRVEAERDRVRTRADVNTFVLRGKRVRCVLDQDEVVPPRDLSQVVELGRVTGVVHGDDRSGASAHRFLHECGVDVERVGLDVDHDGSGAYVLDDVHRCGEGHGCGYHFMAGSNARGHERRVKAGGAGVEG